MDRRKLSPRPITRQSAGTKRPLVACDGGDAPFGSYVSVLDRARALGLSAALFIAPLGLAGSVAACGGARPVEANGAYQHGPPGYAGHPPPIATIAPPPAQSAPPAVGPSNEQEAPEEPEEE